MNRGKWGQPGVPHRGWSCVNTEDLGGLNTVCAMCETQEIRYVHYMQHPDYPESLGAGCVCAGHMQEDYEAPRGREKALKNVSARRTRWLSRKWNKSTKGNHFLNTDGYNIVAYPKGTDWTFRITNRTTDWSRPSKHMFATRDQAKLAAFDALILLKRREMTQP